MIFRRITILISMACLASGVVWAADQPKVRIETTAGDFVVELNESRAPLSVQNFLQYVQSGFYEGTIFHRVMSGFVIQGGGYNAKLEAKATQDAIPNESRNGLSNVRMSIAMARTSDPHSADSQFYINLVDNLSLDATPDSWGYTVFGRVVDGMDVVDDIGGRPTGPQGGMQDVPAAPVIIEKTVLISQ